MKIHVGATTPWLTWGAVVLGLLLGAAGPVAAQQADATAASVAVDPGGEAGRDALRALSKDKSAAYDLEGDARRAALLDVAARYVALSQDARYRPDERAEGAFRGGELYRSNKQVESASAAFESAAALGVGNEGEVFAARGWLELGHVARRADQPDLALERYTVVTDRFADHVRPAAHAWTWRSKVAVAEGRLDLAGEAVRGFLERFAATYPVEGIRNAERLAAALREAGHDSDALALKADVERRIDAVRTAFDGSEEAVDEALADFAVTSVGPTR